MLPFNLRALGAVTCAWVLSACFFTFSAPASTEAENHRLESDEWRDDLDFLASELKDRHANLFHSVGEDEFERAVESLEKRIPSLSPREIIIEMARVVVQGDQSMHKGLKDRLQQIAKQRLEQLRE